MPQTFVERQNSLQTFVARQNGSQTFVTRQNSLQTFVGQQNCLQIFVARQNVCWTQLSLFVQKNFNALAGPAPYTYSEACLTVCSTRRFNLIPPEFYLCLLSEFFSPHFAVYIKNQLWGHQQIPISWWVVAGRYLFHIVILFNQRVPPTFQSKISKKLFSLNSPTPASIDRHHTSPRHLEPHPWCVVTRTAQVDVKNYVLKELRCL
jgi:hypothetical protein